MTTLHTIGGIMGIRFGTFNLCQFVAPPSYCYERRSKYSEKKWQKKTRWVGEQLQRMQCDVVGFQEVFSVDALTELAQLGGFPYVETVDDPVPEPHNPNLYTAPVVAIASKHPLHSVETVAVNPLVLEKLPLATKFEFSRKPLLAKAGVPGLGMVSFYVVHLKSKRPMDNPPRFRTHVPSSIGLFDALREQSARTVGSLIQRGTEALMIYDSVARQLLDNPHTPIVLLGDLNDDKNSLAVDAISSGGRLSEPDDGAFELLPESAKRKLLTCKLHDAFELMPDNVDTERGATYGGKRNGKVLDYIFLSNAFNTDFENHLAKVVSYQLYDEHLRDGDNQTTDHAQIVVEVVPKRIIS